MERRLQAGITGGEAGLSGEIGSSVWNMCSRWWENFSVDKFSRTLHGKWEGQVKDVGLRVIWTKEIFWDIKVNEIFQEESVKSETNSGYRNLWKPTLKEQACKGDSEKVLRGSDRERKLREWILPQIRRGFQEKVDIRVECGRNWQGSQSCDFVIQRLLETVEKIVSEEEWEPKP